MKAADRSQEIDSLLTFIKESRGFDFTGYKRNSVERRIRKRMESMRVPTVEEYLDRLQVDPDEFTHLFNYILINVTSFFRDPEVWDFLADEALPRLLEAREAQLLRVWVPGCASGEEPFSIAMLLAERLGVEGVRERVKIYATDIDEEALAQARQGIFSERQLADVPATFRKEYFDPSGDAFVFKKDLRSAVIFGRHDIVQDAPISRVDLLLCRNTLMYLNAGTQARALSHFHFALNEWGFLVLGKAEMLFTNDRFFTPVDLRRRVFAKAPLEGGFPERMALLSAAGADPEPGQIMNHVRGREAAFEHSPVAQIVVDRNGALVQANDRARTVFGLEPPDLGRPLQDLEVSYRPVELRSQLETVQAERRPVELKDVHWVRRDGTRRMDVELVPLTDRAGRLMGISVTFSDITAYEELQEEVEQANQELETAMEELQSTNEELETTNEELQSTNEELETTNEELQSTNEELQTINEEVRERSDEVSRVNTYLDSILSSLHAALVVLNRDLRIEGWNTRAQDLWGLTQDHVRGEPFLSLDIGLPVRELGDSIRSISEGDLPAAELQVDAVDRRGHRSSFAVRISAIPEAGGDVQGLIISMDDARTASPS